jgi:hypothetical protein
MKIVELTNNLNIAITNEESEFLEKFISESELAKSQLSDREQTLANHLTVKDVLLRVNNDGKIYYKKRIRS